MTVRRNAIIIILINKCCRIKYAVNLSHPSSSVRPTVCYHVMRFASAPPPSPPSLLESNYIIFTYLPSCLIFEVLVICSCSYFYQLLTHACQLPTILRFIKIADCGIMLRLILDFYQFSLVVYCSLPASQLPDTEEKEREKPVPVPRSRQSLSPSSREPSISSRQAEVAAEYSRHPPLPTHEQLDSSSEYSSNDPPQYTL